MMPSPESTTPAVVLVAPQMGENIGAAARAMLNFGLTDLRIVDPRDGWPSKAATNMAVGAFERMPPVQVFANLAEALADCHKAYATTARLRDMNKPVLTARAAAAESRAHAQSEQKTAFVFGRERSGLDNDEVALCHCLVTMPTNPDFSSINLAQAVMLLSYEWLMSADQTPDKIFDMGENRPATHQEMDQFLTRLEIVLQDGGFFKSPDLKPTMARNLRNMFMRGELTEQEVRTLHGAITALTGKTGT